MEQKYACGILPNYLNAIAFSDTKETKCPRKIGSSCKNKTQCQSIFMSVNSETMFVLIGLIRGN